MATLDKGRKGKRPNTPAINRSVTLLDEATRALTLIVAPQLTALAILRPSPSIRADRLLTLGTAPGGSAISQTAPLPRPSPHDADGSPAAVTYLRKYYPAASASASAAFR
jgi:hypothetical protein